MCFFEEKLVPKTEDNEVTKADFMAQVRDMILIAVVTALTILFTVAVFEEPRSASGAVPPISWPKPPRR